MIPQDEVDDGWPIQRSPIYCEYGLDVVQQDAMGNTPLHDLVFVGNIEMLTRWIEGHDADVEIVTKGEKSLLSFALKSGIFAIVNILLDYGANVHSRNKLGLTPLHVAVENNCSNRILQTLLDRGADINALTNDNCTPLLLATRKNDPRIASFLLNAGANHLIRDKRGSTALHLAAAYGIEPIIKMFILLDMPIDDIDQDGRTALHFAAEYGRSTTKTLIDIGANIHAKTKQGHTPVYLAASSFSVFSCKKLLDSGADLQEAIRGAFNRPEGGFRQVEMGRMLFLECARYGNVEGMRSVMEREMMTLPSTKTPGGEALIVAAANQSFYVVNFLVKNGVPINHQRALDGMTALQISVELGNKEIVELLLSCKNINSRMKDKNGRSALDIAKALNHEHLIPLLNATLEVEGPDRSAPPPTSHFPSYRNSRMGDGIYRGFRDRSNSFSRATSYVDELDILQQNVLLDDNDTSW